MTASGATNRKYVASLALVAVAILALGWRIRPRDQPKGQNAVTSETELARLTRLAELRSLEGMTAYFSSIAEELDASVLRTPGGETTALVWDETTVVAARPPDRMRDDGAPGAAARSDAPATEVPEWGPAMPATSMRWPAVPGALSPVQHRPTPASPGDWVVAVWRAGARRAFAMGNVLQRTRLRCGPVVTEEVLSSVPLVETMIGGGLFDVNGDLLGVILACGDRLSAVTPGGVDAMLTRAATVEHRLLARFGLAAGVPGPEEQAYFGAADGVVVREVWIGSDADVAGLEPGDVIRSLDGAPVAALSDLERLSAPDRRSAALGIQRLRAPGLLTVDVPGAAASAAATPTPRPESGAGLLWESPAPGVRVDRVVPGSAAARTGLLPDDRLVGIDGAAPLSASGAETLLSTYQSRPVFLSIVRGGRRLGMVLR